MATLDRLLDKRDRWERKIPSGAAELAPDGECDG